MTHTAESVLDGNNSTAWVEAADGQGIGESLMFEFDDTYRVSGIKVKNGFWVDEKTYAKNSRLKEITIGFSDGSSETLTVGDLYNFEDDLKFTQPMDTKSVSITIYSVYPGSKYQDTCITEVSFY